MRVLYVPLYTSTDIRGCSTFHFSRLFFKQLVEEHFDLKKRNRVVYERMFDLLESIRDKYKDRSHPTRELLKQLPEHMSHDEWVEAVQQTSDRGFDLLNTQSRFDRSKNYFRRMMEVVGYKDTCQTDMPEWRKL